MNIIDFRFRPHTEKILNGLVESPIFYDGLVASGVDIEAFLTSAKSVKEIVQEVKAQHIVKAILVGRDAETTYQFASNNEELKRFLDEAPGLFCAFAGLDPHKGMEAIDELQQRITRDHFTGAAIDPIYNKLPIDAAEFYPIYAKCCELSVPIIITTGPARFTQGTVSAFAHPNQIDKVAAYFPDLKIVVSHGAWPYVNDMIGCAFRNKNVWLEISEYERFPQSEAYLQAANRILQNRFLFASAHPFVHFKDAIETYQNMAFEKEVLPKIMFDNAAKLLGLDT